MALNISYTKHINYVMVTFLTLYVLDPIFLHYGAPRSPSIIVGLYILAFCLYQRRVFIETPVFILLSLALLFSLISINYLYSSGIGLAVQLSYYVVITFSLYSLSRQVDPRVYLKYTFYLTSLFLIISVLLQAGGGASRTGMHPGGNPSHLAGYLAALIVVGYFLIVTRSSKSKEQYIIYLVIATLFLCLLATQGFNALIGLVASTSFVVLYSYTVRTISNKKLGMYKACMAAVILFVCVLFFINFESILTFLNEIGFRTRKFDQLLMTGDADLDVTTSGRSKLFYEYLGAINAYGVGHGLQSSKYLVASGLAPHNQYITLLFEQGFFALINIVLLLAYWFYSGIKSGNKTKVILVVCLGIMMLGNDMLYYKYGWYFIFLIMCVTSVGENKANRTTKVNE